MLSLIPLSAAAFSAAAAYLLGKYWKQRGCHVPGIFLYLMFVLPFAAGGFYTYLSAVTASCLVIHLVTTAKKQGYLRITLNLNSAAVALVVLGYCITPFWAADKGMAVFGIARYLPMLLYVLALMQLTPEQKREGLALIPVSGAAMTALSCLMLLLPGADARLTVNGRLAGFLQYPNTYAAFLLAGLILQYSGNDRRKSDILVDAMLIVGVILSGSKTGFVLLVVTAVGIAILYRKIKSVLTLAGFILCGLVLALMISKLDILRHVNRFADIRLSSHSFLVRLLYFKDVLPMILKNPVGCGYLGYRALQGTFQTGKYYVAYIHNGFLQLLFEIGWVPALTMAAALLRGMCSQKTAPGYRLLLFVILAHCMMDFDLQFFVFWVILLACLDFETGVQWKLRKHKPAGIAAASLCAMLCLWLAASDFCYSLGKPDISLKLTPFHTDALCIQLQRTANPEELDNLADRILKRNPTASLAYSAKANAALSRGDVLNMMAYKEQAIACSPYTAEEYMDYFDKLYGISKLYSRKGDTVSAEYCERKIVYLYERIKAVQSATDPLAKEVDEYMLLKLPIRYRIYMRMLEKRYQQQ